jgi:glucose-6-phosphate 1-dehydrogenase
MQKLVMALSALAMLAGSAPSIAAAPCRDAKGKFVKCTKPAPPKPTKCRDVKGHYARCSTKGAKPA